MKKLVALMAIAFVIVAIVGYSTKKKPANAVDTVQTTMILTTSADQMIKEQYFKGPIYEDQTLSALIAMVVIGEAEGEPEEGKRLVIDTILNRVDSKDFPNSIEDVIFQRNAFSCIVDGSFIERVKKVASNESSMEYYYNLIREEELCRKDYRVLYFHANNYGSWGTPLYSVGNHYFSY